MDIKEIEKKLLAICILEPKKINDLLNTFSLDNFSEEPRKIFKIMQDNFKNGAEFEFDDLDIYSKQYIDLTIEKEFTIVNFDKYMRKFYELIRKDKLRKALKDFKEDDFDTLRKKTSKVFEENTNVFESKRIDIKTAFDEFYNEMDNFEEDNTIDLGYKALNEMITLDEGDVMVIAGNTGLGKTALALNIILKSILNKNHRVLFVSLEMATSQVLARIISNMTLITLNKLKRKNRKYLTDEELHRIGMVQGKIVNNLDILDTSNTDIDYVIQEIKEMDKIKNYDYIVIDYIQLLKAEGKSRTEVVTNASLRVKRLARELKPVIALAQLNRDNVKRNDKKPLLTDLKDSSQLEQDCSFGIVLHSEEYHDKDNKSNDIIQVDVYIDKNRTGPIGMFKTAFNKQYQIFKEIE